MAAAKKVEKILNDEKVINVIDVFWDGWFNSFKTFQSFQKGIEEKSLQALESQKELIQATSEQFTRLEEEAKKLLAEWNSNIQEVLENVLPDFGVQNLAEWTDKFEEVEQKVEALAFSPSKKTFEALSKSQAELESALKEAIKQQQNNRDEVVDAIGGYVDQLKQTQNGVLNTLELNNALLVK